MSLFNKALIALGLRVEKGDVPAPIIKVEIQQESCINNKLIYNINNKSVIVITCNGDKFEGNNVEKEQLEKLRTSNVSQIIDILTPKTTPKEDATKEKKIVSNFLSLFEGSSDFDIINDELYFKGIKTIPIPTLITARFIELIESIIKLRYSESFTEDFELEKAEEEYNSLKMFTLKLLLNPIEEARQDALKYINTYSVKLTSNGNMVMFRRICSVEDSNKDLVEFISKQYIKVKSWKKAVGNYIVHKQTDGTYFLMGIPKSPHDATKDISYVGNLKELYQNLPTMEENRYTDDYTKTYDIRIGQTYKINESDIDVNKRGSCGGALHLTTKDAYDYSGFGDTPVCAIVSPQHIYKMDSGYSGKIGVKQMFIAAVTTLDENGDYEDIDNQALINFDEHYHNENLFELEHALIHKSFNVISVADEVTELSIPEVKNITELLKNRVVTI